MSKIDNNNLLSGVSGMLGDNFVIRRVRGQLQMANKPRKVGRRFTKTQESIQNKFLNASRYAKLQMALPESAALYETGITNKKHSAYTVAVSDYLIAPTVGFIQAMEYKGKVGDMIVVNATDDFMVTEVKVVIIDASGNELERGVAVKDAASHELWRYLATTDNPSLAGTTIRAIAFDRPGNSAAEEVRL